MIIISKTDGENFTIVDDSQQVSVFNGTAIVQIPKVIFAGTLDQINQRVQMSTDEVTRLNNNLSAVQTKLDQDTAIQEVIQSSPQA
jgi:hypothetical protein